MMNTNISLFPPIRRVHIQKNIYTLQIQWNIIDKMSMQLILMLKKVNAYRERIGEINEHTSYHLQMCNNLYKYACSKLFN